MGTYSLTCAEHAKFRKFRAGPGTMMLHLALDGALDWKAGATLRNFAYVHIAPSFDYMTAAYSAAMDGLLPQAPVLVVGQPTAIDPGRAPPGKRDRRDARPQPQAPVERGDRAALGAGWRAGEMGDLPVERGEIGERRDRRDGGSGEQQGDGPEGYVSGLLR